MPAVCFLVCGLVGNSFCSIVFFSSCRSSIWPASREIPTSNRRMAPHTPSRAHRLKPLDERCVNAPHAHPSP
ncbi:hypothetical protein HDK77DRAFT_445800 [Phyllosticta capitalensis]